MAIVRRRVQPDEIPTCIYIIYSTDSQADGIS